MLIKDIISLIERLDANGKYITLDDTLFRSMDVSELRDILATHGMGPNYSTKNRSLLARPGSIENDFSNEIDYMSEINPDINRKLKLPKRFNYPKTINDPEGNDKKTITIRKNREKYRNKLNKNYNIISEPTHIGFYKSFSRSLNGSLGSFALNKNTLTVEFYKEPLKNLRGAKLVPFGWLPNYFGDMNIPNNTRKTYISYENEMEDRLYFTSDFLPFKGPLKKYIKCVYFSWKNFKSEEEKDILEDTLEQLRLDDIDIRVFDLKNSDRLNPNELRGSSSEHYDLAYGDMEEPPEDTSSKEYKKWLKKLEKRTEYREKIENGNPLYYHKGKLHPDPMTYHESERDLRKNKKSLAK